jgi:glycerophosphoryl diester phosphodiesterase
MKKTAIIILLVAFLVIICYPLYKNHLPQKFHNLKKGLNDKLELYLAIKEIKKFSHPSNNPELPKIIAHAGGGVQGLKYTNSLEALEENYAKGFRWFEMDAILTSDNQLVMLHDWGSAISGIFNQPEGKRTLKEFNEFTMIKGLTQMDFSKIAIWFENHPDSYLVLDNKSDLATTLNIINSEFSHIKPQLIITINRFRELAIAKKSGFDNIFFSLYVSDYGLTYSDIHVIEFAKKAPIMAVCLPEYRAKSDLTNKLSDQNNIVFAFTIDDTGIAKELFNNGINGIFSNFIDYTILENI